MDAEGKIDARPGPEEDRVRWNIALLKLDLPSVARERANTWRLLDGCRSALENMQAARPQEERHRWALLLQKLLPEAAQRFLLLEVYGFPVLPDLREIVIAKRAAGDSTPGTRGALPWDEDVPKAARDPYR